MHNARHYQINKNGFLGGWCVWCIDMHMKPAVRNFSSGSESNYTNAINVLVKTVTLCCSCCRLLAAATLLLQLLLSSFHHRCPIKNSVLQRDLSSVCQFNQHCVNSFGKVLKVLDVCLYKKNVPHSSFKDPNRNVSIENIAQSFFKVRKKREYFSSPIISGH